MRLVLLVVLALASSSSSIASAKDWSSHARRFTGESDEVRRQAIQELKKYPKLEDELKRALTSRSENRFLALDVISTLRMRKLLPALYQAAETDETGSCYNAINSLLESEKDRKRARTVYYQ